MYNYRRNIITKKEKKVFQIQQETGKTEKRVLPINSQNGQI